MPENQSAAGARKSFVSDGPTRAVQVAQHRVIYGDTDMMGVVYHGTYLRYLEGARIEFMRHSGLNYVEFEGLGIGLPVIDLAVRYRAPARFDDLVTMWVDLGFASRSRVHFRYRLTVEAGDRVGNDGTIEVLRAETRHACMALATGRATRLPESIFRTFAAQL